MRKPVPTLSVKPSCMCESESIPNAIFFPFSLQLSAIERFAMRFVEETDSHSAKQLAEAEAEIERQKKDWEMNRLAAAREEEERRQRLADDEPMLTYAREDANTQVNSSKKIGLRGKRMSGGKRTLLSAKSSRCNSRTNSLDGSVDGEVKKEKPKGKKVLKRGRRLLKEEQRDDSESLHSNDSHDLPLKNHNADPTSPRTRSRGAVNVNLWTLDGSASPSTQEGPGSPDFQSTVKKRKRGRPKKEDKSDGVNNVSLSKQSSLSPLSPFANPNLIRTRRGSSSLKQMDISDVESNNESPDGPKLKKLKLSKRKRRSEGSVDSNGLP